MLLPHLFTNYKQLEDKRMNVEMFYLSSEALRLIQSLQYLMTSLLLIQQ